MSRFEDTIPVLDIPTTYPRPAVRSFDGAIIHRTIDSDITNKIYNFANDKKLTPYMILLATYYILLSKYSMQNDIVVGSPIVGRDNSNFANVIGMFVNTLPLRMQINDNCTIREFLDNVKSMCLNSFNHQTYPLNELVNHLNLQRNSSRSPLFDVLFTYQNNGLENLNLNGINSSYYLPDTKISKFDLSLEVTPINNSLSLNFEYCTKLYDKDFVSNFANHYLNTLSAILENPDINICDISILSNNEKKQILQEFNDTKKYYPSDKTVTHLFEEQVKKTPNNVAIISGDKRITYKKLQKKVNQIANYLFENGVNRKSIIGIMMPHSPEMIASVLAVLKLGASYIPIDPKYPIDRINYILSDSGAKIMLVHSTTLDLPINNSCKKIEINLHKGVFDKCSTEIINCSVPEDLAYLIYTSGSTGKPKGVSVGNQSLTNYIYWASLFYCNSEPKNFPLYSSFAFDLTVTSIYTPLITGGSIVIYKGDDILVTLKKIFKDNISDIIKLTPAHLSFVQGFDLSTTRISKMIVGGDTLPQDVCKNIVSKAKNMTIYNEYGPTEATVGCMIYEYSLSDSQYISVPIGKPINNANIYILDKYLKPVPFGCKGEIYIGGDCLSLGYTNPELNTSRFIKNPFDDSKLLYKTGDIAILHQNNILEYVGRNDFQVKLNGFRIELEEINRTLINYPDILRSFTTVYNNGSKSYLVAYFTADKKINTVDLSIYLQTKLTSYMIPSIFMQLDNFPLTINGKIDKSKLPEPIIESKADYVPPSSELEKKLCGIWQDLFGIKKIGINDNFFDLGGDSLSAIKFQVEALNQNLNLSYSDIFALPTISQLAKKANTGIVNEKLKQEYDYTKINKLLAFNDIDNISKKVKTHKLKNVLLTGATGFLGAHLLDSYLSNTSRSVIYCLVRKKSGIDPEDRLRKILDFYFGNKYDKMFGNRIRVISGDVSVDNLGLIPSDYKTLVKKIHFVINSAAIVKHYGEYERFYDINVLGTQNLVEFCKKHKKKLYHISTASISGMGLSENNLEKYSKVLHFSEKDLYKNQNLNNAYIETKFEAERLILENIPLGLEACIFRMGNIANRYSDAKFQINISENAFVNRIKSILKLQILQEGFKDHKAEFAPVDLCADAILKIIMSNPKFTVFHIFNSNLISFTDIVKTLKNMDIKLDFVSDDVFSAKVNKFLKTPDLKAYVSGIVTDLDTNKVFRLNANILLDTNFTCEYLSKVNFNWPKIDETYIKNYVKYFKRLNYFD